MAVPCARPFSIKQSMHRFKAKQNDTRTVRNVVQPKYLQIFLKKLPIGIFTLRSFSSHLRGRAGSPHWPLVSLEAVER